MKILSIYLLLAANVIMAGQALSTELPKPLVNTDWLADNLEHVSIIDVRSTGESFTSNPVFEKSNNSGVLKLIRVGGHIPGAHLVLYKHVRGNQIINGTKVKYVLPGKSAFEKLMQNAGIHQQSNIVVVTNAENDFDLTMATRMYWQIKYYGHENVSILNGGTAQWLVDGRDIVTNSENAIKGDWLAKMENTNLLASSEEVIAAIDNDSIQIVDVRPLGQYLGTYKSAKVEEKGHIPSAKSYPVDLVATRNTPVKFSSKSELTQLTKALSVDLHEDTITYCNSGHMASGAWFVFHEILGMNNIKLYDGSMHQWTAEKRPVVKMKLE
tara:strand:- start:161266 stop:162243 length:978 start_codon:yes stop_codon:yes gene_type:complete